MLKLLTDSDYKDISKIITPSIDKLISNNVISWGLSSCGYDIRLANEYYIFTNIRGGIVDPKKFNSEFLEKVIGDYCTVPPNSFALGRSIEYFKMPNNVMGICVGKSTYARCGIIVNITPLEPGWQGHLTIEISNTTPLPARVYSNEGIAQVLLFQMDNAPLVTYEDRKGKYQKQTGITLPK